MADKKEKHIKRKMRVRSKVFGTAEHPRLSVFRSNKYIYGQVIDDAKGITLAASKGPKKEGGKVGEELAKKAAGKKIKKVVFDRGGFKYHGNVKNLAEGARKGGLKL